MSAALVGVGPVAANDDAHAHVLVVTALPRASMPAGDIGIGDPPIPVVAVGPRISAALSTPARRPVGRPPVSGSKLLVGRV